MPLNTDMHWELAGAVLEHQSLVAPCIVASGPHVGLGTRPPYPDHLLARVANESGALDRGTVHHTPAPGQHVILFVLEDCLPLRFLFETGMGHWKGSKLEPVLLGECEEGRNRFFAHMGCHETAGQFSCLLVGRDRQALSRYAG